MQLRVLKIALLSLLILKVTVFYGQADPHFERSYQELKEMLESKEKQPFKKAVFSIENAYLAGKLDTLFINKRIHQLKLLCEKLAPEISYEETDKIEVQKWASIFKVMTDTIPIKLNDSTKIHHLPFKYDVEDAYGLLNWTTTFVSGLLQTNKGNCNALTYLYKILAQELNTDAHLAIAPNHIYIKHRSEKTGWFNTELTSAQFPLDAWLVATSYISLEAMVNKLYLYAQSNKESIAMCMVDLALGYKNKYPENYHNFVLKCTQLALQYYPFYSPGLLLQATTKKEVLDTSMQAQGIKDYEHLKNEEDLKLYRQINKEFANLHNLGYRNVPKKTYEKWLENLNQKKKRISNTK